METVYKLTDQDGYTRRGLSGETKWYPGKTLVTSGNGPLCTDAWVHAYTSPLLAVLLNPIHANIQRPRLWKCSGETCISDHGLKIGCSKLTIVKEMSLPSVTTEKQIRFAIMCATAVYKEKTFNIWAQDWLDNKDRTIDAAAEAAARASEAARAAAVAAAAPAWAARAARATAWAIEAAAEAAEAAEAAAAAARAAARAAAEATAWAAKAAARAAAWSAAWSASINLIQIAEKACSEE